jgi:hypothetical protein
LQIDNVTEAIIRSDKASVHSGESLASLRVDVIRLLLASVVTMYFELLVIRYLSTEIRAFTNLKNLPLIGSFFGIGLGMLSGHVAKRLGRVFPFAGAALFLLTRFAVPLGLSIGDVSWEYNLSSLAGLGSRFLLVAWFLSITLLSLA